MLSASFPTIFAGLALVTILYYIRNLIYNLRKAQKIGLPYTINPTSISVFLDVFLFSSPLFRHIVDNWLPLSVADDVNHSTFPRRWAARDRLFQRFGGCFMRVKPFGVILDVCDADVVRQICSHRDQFPKPLEMYST